MMNLEDNLTAIIADDQRQSLLFDSLMPFDKYSLIIPQRRLSVE
jgi:hypothetical protein